jgi:hypothetical protein
MEVAGSGNDAFRAGMAARMPPGMRPLAAPLAAVLAAGMLDVIAMGDGELV